MHFRFFDPNRIFLQARARWNTRLGSKNLKILFSGFLTRTVYFSPSSSLKYTARVKQPEKCVSGCVTRAVYFCTLELAEIYGSGQTTGKLGFPFFDPNRIFLHSSLKYTVRVSNRKGNEHSGGVVLVCGWVGVCALCVRLHVNVRVSMGVGVVGVCLCACVCACVQKAGSNTLPAF